MTKQKNVPYTIRLDPVLVDILKQTARAEGKQIRQIVEEAIKEKLMKKADVPS